MREFYLVRSEIFDGAGELHVPPGRYGDVVDDVRELGILRNGWQRNREREREKRKTMEMRVYNQPPPHSCSRYTLGRVSALAGVCVMDCMQYNQITHS